MAGGGVPYLVDALHDGVECCVVAYGGVGAVKVVVDSSRQAYDSDVMKLRELLRSGERAVSSYDYEGVDAELFDGFVGLRLAFRCAEFFAACGLEYCASSLNRVADAFGGQFLDISVDETFIAAVDSVHFPSRIDGRPRHGPYACVHSGSVTPGGQDSYCRNVHDSICEFTTCKYSEKIINRETETDFS